MTLIWPRSLSSVKFANIAYSFASGKSHFARVKIPGNLPRLVPVDDMTDEESKDERYGFIAMEKLIAAHLAGHRGRDQ